MPRCCPKIHTRQPRPVPNHPLVPNPSAPAHAALCAQLGTGTVWGLAHPRSPRHHPSPRTSTRTCSISCVQRPCPRVSSDLICCLQPLFSLPFSQLRSSPSSAESPRFLQRSPLPHHAACMMRPQRLGMHFWGKIWDLSKKSFPVPSQGCAMNWSFTTGAHTS